MALTRYLVDKSVLARLAKPRVREELVPLSERGLLATCSMIEMELLFSAKSPADRDRIQRHQRNFEWLSTPDEVWHRAIEVQCALVESGTHRSVKIPDLLIAAIAERHRVGVLHYDHDFDRIAEITGQVTRWVVSAGSAD